jgi:hypothetical protein
MQHEPSFSTGESPSKACPRLTVINGGVCETSPNSLQVVGNGLQALTAGTKGPEGAAILRQQRPEGVGGKQHSVTLLTESDLERLSDEDLQRYIRRIADRMQAAHAAWKAADSAWMAFGCDDDKAAAESAKLECGTLWAAEQKALREQWKRPHLVAQREAEIAARMAAEPGATR